MSDNLSLNVKVVPDKKFKTAAVCLMLRRPLKREEATKNALLASVLGAGSKEYPSLFEISKYMEELYGAMFGSMVVKKAEFQIIRMYIEFSSTMDDELLGRAVAFLKEVLFNPLVNNGEFSKEIFENEKNMLRDSILERINDKNSYVRLKCVENMCKDEAFGVYNDGYAEDLEEIDAKALYSHYEEVVSTTPIEFIASGNIDEAGFKELVNDNFKDRAVSGVKLEVGPLVYNPQEVVVHEETLKVNQGKICMGLRLGCDYFGKQFHTALMLNEILGGSGNSKLFMNLREKDSLCYSVFSFLYRAKSLLMIQSGVETDKIDIAIEKINEQVKAMKDGEITDEELHLAKKGLVSGFRSITDSHGSVLEFSYTQYILGDNEDVDDIISGIEGVSVKDVVDLAKRLYTDTIYVLKGEKEGEDE